MFQRAGPAVRRHSRALQERAGGARRPQRRLSAGPVAHHQGALGRGKYVGLSRTLGSMLRDIPNGYQEGGADYLYALLTGYANPPADMQDGGRNDLQQGVPGSSDRDGAAAAAAAA